MKLNGKCRFNETSVVRQPHGRAVGTDRCARVKPAGSNSTSFLAFVLLVVLAGAWLASTALANDRVDININDVWKFYRADVAGAEGVGFDDSEWDTLDLPHTYNAFDGQDGGGYYRGIAWYRKHYTIPSAYSGKRIFLYFESASKAADVYVNGAYIGRHEGSYASFCFDITDRVNSGSDNVIAVKIDNSSAVDIAPLSGDFTQWGGICRTIHLLITNNVHVTPLDYASPGVYLTQTNVSSGSADLEVKTKIRNDNTVSKNVTVRSIVKRADDSVVTTLTDTHSVASESNYDFVQNTTISNPHLWKGRSDPYLYKVFVEVEVDSVVVDIVEQSLGLRYYSVDTDNGFYLNGQYLDLRGVAIHEDREDKGRAISDADRQQDIDIIMEMGCNFVRLSHYQHAEKIYNLADENGLVIWTEIPLVNKILDTTPFADNAKKQLKELIRQNYNHPSVLFWGLFNEITLVGGPDPTTLVNELNTLAHQEDTTRLTTAASSSDAHATNWIPDIISFNKYFGWYGSSAAAFAGWADNMHANRPFDEIGISEYGAGASIHHHEENPPSPSPGGPWHPEEYQNYFHEVHWMAMKTRPYLWCKTIWNGFDFGADHRNEGDRPGINDKGMVIRDRTVKKDAYYWYKSNWSDEPVVYISSRRFTPRYQNPVQVKVYSNCDSVELFINGSSKSSTTGTDHIFKWTNIKLKPGTNEIKAVGTIGVDEYEDTCFWDFVLTGKLAVSSVTASDFQNTPTEYHPPEHTIDRNFGTRWAAEGEQWIKYDLGSVRDVNKVYISFYNGNQRQAYFDIDASTDNVGWTPVLTDGISSGTTTALEEFVFEDVDARYIRIYGHGNSSSNWNSYYEVEIYGGIDCSSVIEAGCGLETDWSGPANVPDCYVNFYDFAVLGKGWLVPDIDPIYEAEDAVLVGPAVANNHLGYTGTGFADYPDVDSAGDYIQWTVNVPEAGSYTLEFRYANGSGYDRPLEIKVNGVIEQPGLSFPPTGVWADWDTVGITANLIAGNNQIRATTIGIRGPNIDHLNMADFVEQDGFDITDLVNLARQWLECNDPQNANCGFWQ